MPCGQALHRVDALRVHGVEVELDGVTLMPILASVPSCRVLEKFRRVEQRLGRDAADVEAGAAERLAALGAGGLEAELRGADRGDIAAGAGCRSPGRRNRNVSHITSSVIPGESRGSRFSSSGEYSVAGTPACAGVTS